MIIDFMISVYAAKMLCYSRLTFMPMSYLYGRKFVGPITPLIEQLREEIYNKPYRHIKWSKMRHVCAEVSLVTTRVWFLDLCVGFLLESLYIHTTSFPSWIRKITSEDIVNCRQITTILMVEYNVSCGTVSTTLVNLLSLLGLLKR